MWLIFAFMITWTYIRHRVMETEKVLVTRYEPGYFLCYLGHNHQSFGIFDRLVVWRYHETKVIEIVTYHPRRVEVTVQKPS